MHRVSWPKVQPSASSRVAYKIKTLDGARRCPICVPTTFCGFLRFSTHVEGELSAHSHAMSLPPPCGALRRPASSAWPAWPQGWHWVHPWNCFQPVLWEKYTCGKGTLVRFLSERYGWIDYFERSRNHEQDIVADNIEHLAASILVCPFFGLDLVPRHLARPRVGRAKEAHCEPHSWLKQLRSLFCKLMDQNLENMEKIENIDLRGQRCDAFLPHFHGVGEKPENHGSWGHGHWLWGSGCRLTWAIEWGLNSEPTLKCWYNVANRWSNRRIFCGCLATCKKGLVRKASCDRILSTCSFKNNYSTLVKTSGEESLAALRVATACSYCTWSTLYSTGIGSEVQGSHGSELERAPLWARLTSAEIYPEQVEITKLQSFCDITVPERFPLKSRKDGVSCGIIRICVGTSDVACDRARPSWTDESTESTISFQLS